MEYKDLDKLNELQDILLALASYDWYFFHDQRIERLKKDYQVKASNTDIFRYYHGKNDHFIELNNKRYVERYKTYLNAIL